MTKKFISKILALTVSISIFTPFVSSIKATENEPSILGHSALVMDMDTKEVIYSKNAEEIHSPASTTKLMTALLFAENNKKSDMVEYTQEALSQTSVSLSNEFKKMNVGDKITAEDAMEGLMIHSGNDTAYIIANTVSGSTEAFVKLMNDRAKQMGMKNTNYVNPNGLENGDSYNTTTAYDLALLAIEAYKNDWVKQVATAKQADVLLNGAKYTLYTRDKLMGKDGNLGGKTGNETVAGHCFVGYYNISGRNLVTVVLKSEYGAFGDHVFEDTAAIAKYAQSAKKDVYIKANENAGEVTLEYKLFKFFGPTKTVNATFSPNSDVLEYKNDFNTKNTVIKLTEENMDAWSLISKNDAKLTLVSGDYSEEITGTVNLSLSTILKDNIVSYIGALAALIFFIVLITLIIKVINNKKKNNYRRRRRY